jgi:hypothetical protein
MLGRGRVKADARVVEIGVGFAEDDRANDDIQDNGGEDHQADHRPPMPPETAQRHLRWRPCDFHLFDPVDFDRIDCGRCHTTP